jgi:hypothetical protein
MKTKRIMNIGNWPSDDDSTEVRFQKALRTYIDDEIIRKGKKIEIEYDYESKQIKLYHPEWDKFSDSPHAIFPNLSSTLTLKEISLKRFLQKTFRQLNENGNREAFAELADLLTSLGKHYSSYVWED